MDSAIVTVGLPIALAIIMFGLGLDLTVADFGRVARAPKAIVVALVCQIVVLPAVCFGVVVLLDLPPLLAIGMLLLAASPGGTTANLFSHLFRGDVALNVSLTAINSILSLLTLPLITNFAIQWFDQGGSVTLPFFEVVQVFVIVLVPVAIGMAVRHGRPGFAARMERPVRIASAVILAVLVVGILVDQRDSAVGYFADVGVAAALFCATSLVIGYFVPRLAGVGQPRAIASSMEIGIHNNTLAIVIAVDVLDSVEISIPAAVYSIVMFLFAAIWGKIITRHAPAVSRTRPRAAG